ncbi:MAG: phenylalanine 4-monooxygenase [Gammaproteobacteria bacterium]|nr:phenylalanine 4-monooxygenase [Gammaproteobacteria bacterium]
MGKGTKYIAKYPDKNGIIPYTKEEDAIWAALYQRQMKVIPGRAAPIYMEALDKLGLPADRVPQPEEVSSVLRAHTGWEVAPVPALINFDDFFKLLSEKKFPAASFIRTWDEFDYLQEPDVFHEIFGHTPLLIDSNFAAFTEAYGEYGLRANKEDRVKLAALYWFTVEFGLIDTTEGLRAYGAGIISSPGEAVYAVESDTPERRPFDAVDALRTPYRIDIFQTVYFVIDGLEDLFELAHKDLFALIAEARRLGMHEPTFPPKEAEKQTANM